MVKYAPLIDTYEGLCYYMNGTAITQCGDGTGHANCVAKEEYLRVKGEYLLSPAAAMDRVRAAMGTGDLAAITTAVVAQNCDYVWTGAGNNEGCCTVPVDSVVLHILVEFTALSLGYHFVSFNDPATAVIRSRNCSPIYIIGLLSR